MSHTMRLFFGIPIDDEVSGALFDSIATLSSRADGVKWIPAANYHVTLCFLGDTDERTAEAIDAELSHIDSLPDSFEITFEGVGFFPPRGRNVRIIHTPVTRGETMCRRLFETVSAVCRRHLPDRRYKCTPHVTLGRVKRTPKVDLRDVAAGVSLYRSTTCDRFVLYESTLGPEGARYTARKSYRLPAV